ncbi:hypothetical protein Tco_0762186 [Tanacetum coccineum]
MMEMQRFLSASNVVVESFKLLKELQDDELEKSREMMLQSYFLHFLGNRSASFSARLADVPMLVGSPAGSAANIPDEELEMAVAASVANNAVGADVVPPSAGRPCKTLFGSLASMEDPVDSAIGAEVVPPSADRRRRGEFTRPVGSPWRVIAPSLDVDSKGKRVAFPNSTGSSSFKKRKHVVLDEGPSSPKSVPYIAPTDEACIEEARSSRDALCNLSYPDVQCRLDGLTLTELTNFHDVVAVRFVMSNNLLTREAQALSAEVFRLRGEVEALKDKLDLANQERTSLEKAMLVGRSQALREVASLGIGVELVDMKEFDPNAEHNYDRSIESFYQVKFLYVDLLVHYAGQSVGKLMTLKPLIIPFGNASAAGPSASPFL